MQARKKLSCHVIVKDYSCNVLRKVWRPATLLTKDPKTGVFLWIL